MTFNKFSSPILHKIFSDDYSSGVLTLQYSQKKQHAPGWQHKQSGTCAQEQQQWKCSMVSIATFIKFSTMLLWLYLLMTFGYDTNFEL